MPTCAGAGWAAAGTVYASVLGEELHAQMAISNLFPGRAGRGQGLKLAGRLQSWRMDSARVPCALSIILTRLSGWRVSAARFQALGLHPHHYHVGPQQLLRKQRLDSESKAPWAVACSCICLRNGQKRPISPFPDSQKSQGSLQGSNSRHSPHIPALCAACQYIADAGVGAGGDFPGPRGQLVMAWNRKQR